MFIYHSTSRFIHDLFTINDESTSSTSFTKICPRKLVTSAKRCIVGSLYCHSRSRICLQNFDKKLVGFSLLKPIFSGCAFSEFVIIARQNRFHTKGTRNQPVSGSQKKEWESYAGSEKIGIPLTNGHSSSIPSHM